MTYIVKFNGSEDPQNTIVVTIETDAENDVTVNAEINFNEEEEFDFSGMNYEKAMDHLTGISTEIHDSQDVMYSKPYFTSLFETLVELSESQPERMERTLLIISLICNLIELVLLSNEDESMWDIDEEFSFPIPKEKIKMSLEGLVTPYDWEDEEIDLEKLDLESLETEERNLVEALLEVTS